MNGNIAEPTDWLLAGPAWVQYRTLIDLLGQSENDPEVIAARKATLADPQVKSLLEESSTWPGGALKITLIAQRTLQRLPI